MMWFADGGDDRQLKMLVQASRVVYLPVVDSCPPFAVSAIFLLRLPRGRCSGLY